jgi:phage I-like protein
MKNRAPITCLRIAVPDGPPTEFRLFANGVTETLKGNFSCNEASCALVLSAMKRDGRDKLPIDFNHGMVNPNGDGRAAGWFVPASRDGALWATEVEWTPLGKKSLEDREYRLFSPTFRRDDKNNVVEVINVALTNLPATLHQTPLAASEFAPGEEKNDMTLEELLAQLKVKDVTELSAQFSQAQTLAAQNAQLVAATQALNAELQTVKARDAATAAQAAATEHANLITELSQAGKLPPALHGWAKTQTLESLKAFGAGATGSTTLPVRTVEAGTVPRESGLTDDERAICSQLSITAKDFLAEKREITELSRLRLAGDKNIEAKDVCIPDRLDSGFDPEAPASKKVA